MGDVGRQREKQARNFSALSASFLLERTTMNRILRQSLAAVAACLLVASAAAQSCVDCGVVQSMRLVEQQGQSSGVGMVAGGVLGGVLGHQIGSGRGNTVATIAGAGVG